MSLTADDVREIMRILEESEFDELDLETAGFRLTLRRSASGAIEQAGEGGSDVSFSDLVRDRGEKRAAAQAASAPAAQAEGVPTPGAAPAQGAPGVVDVPAPLLGVFYRAPKPGAGPFVEVGQRVDAETVIGIIEVMKLMNSVRAGVAGEIVEIPARNAAMVEYGEPLIRVRTSG
jgi:acetyl-CoA carboxylase biotin carboxyl carrier protein